MKKRNIVIIAVLAVLIIAGIVIAVLVNNNADSDDAAQDQAQADDVVQDQDQDQDQADDADEAPGQALYSFTMRQVTDGRTTFYVVENPGNGPTLSFAADSGIGLIEIEENGRLYAFRDLSGDGILNPFEDWRLSPMERAQDLAARLDIEQLSGLMLFGPHEFSVVDGLSPLQRDYIGDSHVRSLLHAADNNVANSVLWNNEIQAFIETESVASGLPLIPAIIASDPRSTPLGGHTLALDGSAFIEAGTGQFVSQWPENLGLAATHNVALVQGAAGMQAQEYRALGIRWALGPQVDLASDPRWGRNWQTFGESVSLASDLTEVFVNAMQGNGVATTIKHFPADGAGEGGRASTALDGSGAFSVFPGGAQDDHLAVFMAGLNSAAVMTSFAVNIDINGNPIWGDNAWSVAYNRAEIELLRNLGWEGVIVTDWFVPADPERPLLPAGRRWGIEQEAWAGIPAYEYYRILSAGVDVFGGMNNLARVLEAYDVWQAAYEAGDENINAQARWRQTGVRVLNLMFEADTFDNPFVVLEDSLAIVGSQAKVDAGIDAQLNSVVMLKNDGVIAAQDLAGLAGLTVYVPANYSRTHNWQTDTFTVNAGPSLSVNVLEGLVGAVVTDEVVLTPEGDGVEEFIMPDLSNVDLILIGMTTPQAGSGFNAATGEFFPRSLQWRPYTADGDNVRRVSIGGLILEDGSRENRSYFGNTGTASNESHLDTFERAVAAVAASGRDIPIIVVLHAGGAATFIPTEIYSDANSILIGYHVAQEAVIRVALGLHEPNGRLPIGMPASMDAVEASYEDVPMDHAPFVDSLGNAWGFGFGLNFSGPIN